jgi:selenocysteine lyase/cysteine desulfurase
VRPGWGSSAKRNEADHIRLCVDGVNGLGIENIEAPAPRRGPLFSPGGFHSFEHRWALKEAFQMHLSMGKARVEERIHALATQTKEGLAKMKHITLHMPMSATLALRRQIEGLQQRQHSLVGSRNAA